ncbi:ABC transporter substrate-binding protein [Brachybacterium sp. GPGPB12]|uniref:ABC transporter substrate-binding protein n=1 Tax=Brachybacterium sp. GPGPB12 TaxID=3023517 RepID=UPI0031342EBF
MTPTSGGFRVGRGSIPARIDGDPALQRRSDSREAGLPCPSLQISLVPAPRAADSSPAPACSAARRPWPPAAARPAAEEGEGARSSSASATEGRPAPAAPATAPTSCSSPASSGARPPTSTPSPALRPGRRPRTSPSTSTRRRCASTSSPASSLPGLAASHEITGSESITLTLQEGITWHDGSEFTAEDVLYTFELGKIDPSLGVAAFWTEVDEMTADGGRSRSR